MSITKYTCPVCKHSIELDAIEVEKDNIFECEECAAEFIILSEKPFRCEPMDGME